MSHNDDIMKRKTVNHESNNILSQISGGRHVAGSTVDSKNNCI
jgi:hypothetical protein